MENQIKRSCADCAAINCDVQNKEYPAFCLTLQLDEHVKSTVLKRYSEEENKKIMSNAALVEWEGYGTLTRVEEIMDFARRMDYHKLGIASCVGLIRETGILAKILRSHNFEVYGIGCKVGAVPKTEVGIDEKCGQVGVNMCNPILQAELLNIENTDLNIVMGLCVGHDSLFYKYSAAPATTLVTKDRVLGHNPAAALYTANSYYKKVFNRE